MLGPNTHSHIEAQLKLTLWKVETFVGVMQETSKHDPMSKPHFMFSLSGKCSPVDTMYEPRNWKSSTFSISSPSSWRLECGILQVISLVFVVSMHRPTSSAVRQSKSNGLWAFSKDSSSSTMSSVKVKVADLLRRMSPWSPRDHSEA